MTVDRRSILRTSAQLATLTATGGLLAGCGREAATAAGGPHPATAAPTRPAATGSPLSPNLFPHVTGSPAAPSPTQPPSPSPAAEQPPLAPGTPQEVVTGPRDRPQVALTFHGQGDPALALALLTAAEQHGAQLTVLAVGSWLDQQPQLARRILDGGHELGNHTQNHLDISSMSPDQAYAEITACADRLKALTGSIGRWFRPSEAQFATSQVKEQARRAGYEHLLSFDLDPRDYADPGADAVQRRILGAVKPGSIVALHMGHQGTVDALPAVLDGLRERGLTAVTASRLCAAT
ncbi:polysaccharide deacetylase family protein [Kitasatospora viridis]|uniref:Peptidoglycan/xylan/chitin deacetylase (PgdA/CDA1 family) n=1 Tax=Kitasatospora viridis TaxID=281105 RepID=A0A561UNQ9_9ACTN|nr:polysaccharide deacetylase family protein [Kitasatospora viridis]TWG00991.1 peptidoglycan/xylan/chitin deacetylase (PgdA/CDA1 family) [Kitasatospora viridis]